MKYYFITSIRAMFLCHSALLPTSIPTPSGRDLFILDAMNIDKESLAIVHLLPLVALLPLIALRYIKAT